MTVSINEELKLHAEPRRHSGLSALLAIRQPAVLGPAALLCIFLLPTEWISQNTRGGLTFLALVVGCGTGVIALGGVSDAGFVPVSPERKAQIARDPLRGTFGAVAIGLGLLMLFSCTRGLSLTPIVALILPLGAALGHTASLALGSSNTAVVRVSSTAIFLGSVAAAWITTDGSLVATILAPLSVIILTRWCRGFLSDEDLLTPRSAGFIATLVLLLGLAR